MALTMTSTRVNTFLQGSPVRRPAARAQAKRLPARQVPRDAPQAGPCWTGALQAPLSTAALLIYFHVMQARSAREGQVRE